MTRSEDTVIRGADGKRGACSFSELGSYAFGAMGIDSVCKRDPRETWECPSFDCWEGFTCSRLQNPKGYCYWSISDEALQSSQPLRLGLKIVCIKRTGT